MKCLSQEQNRMTRSRHKPGSLDLLIRTHLLILHKDLNIIRLVAIIKEVSLIANMMQFFMARISLTALPLKAT